jgi:uncharacterized protein (DUF1330 family)
MKEDYMSSIVPNDEALRALASNPDEGVVVMLNLLKFKGEEGARAYDRYGESVSKILEAHGARIVYAGQAAELLVGDETWDAIVLVAYPSRKVFLEMVNTPEYRTAHVDREQGLERTVLYVTMPMRESERFSQ